MTALPKQGGTVPLTPKMTAIRFIRTGETRAGAIIVLNQDAAPDEVRSGLDQFFNDLESQAHDAHSLYAQPGTLSARYAAWSIVKQAGDPVKCLAEPPGISLATEVPQDGMLGWVFDVRTGRHGRPEVTYSAA